MDFKLAGLWIRWNGRTTFNESNYDIIVGLSASDVREIKEEFVGYLRIGSVHDGKLVIIETPEAKYNGDNLRFIGSHSYSRHSRNGTVSAKSNSGRISMWNEDQPIQWVLFPWFPSFCFQQVSIKPILFDWMEIRQLFDFKIKL